MNYEEPQQRTLDYWWRVITPELQKLWIPTNRSNSINLMIDQRDLTSLPFQITHLNALLQYSMIISTRIKISAQSPSMFLHMKLCGALCYCHKQMLCWWNEGWTPNQFEDDENGDDRKPDRQESPCVWKRKWYHFRPSSTQVLKYEEPLSPDKDFRI